MEIYSGPFFVSGYKAWQEHRRFVFNSLKDLSSRKTSFEGQILEEIRNFLDVLKSYNGKPVDFTAPLTSSVSNNICSLVFGERYAYGDPERIFLDKCLKDVIKIIGQTAAHAFFPWIRHFPFILKLLNYDDGIRAFRNVTDIFKKKIEGHKKTLDSNNIRDFIDGYIIEMKNRQENDIETTFNDKTLESCVGDLFGAGSESVRTTISWLLYTMAALPDVQKKVRQEILEELGAEKQPEFSDQKRLPYTHAVLLEVLRWKYIVPLNIPRYTTADITLGKYTIPKGTTVMANFWAVHHDPRNWENPEEFLPDRFLEDDKKTIKKPFSFMPFSVGKRTCPGEFMANLELFLYFASIMQKFNVEFPDNIKPTFEAEMFVTYSPTPFLIRFISKK